MTLKKGVVGDLQLGGEKVTLNHLECIVWVVFFDPCMAQYDYDSSDTET